MGGQGCCRIERIVAGIDFQQLDRRQATAIVQKVFKGRWRRPSQPGELAVDDQPIDVCERGRIATEPRNEDQEEE